jgi:hypothetical protein
MKHGMAKIAAGVTASFVTLLLCSGCATQVGIAASPSDIYVEVGGAKTVNVVKVFDLGAPAPVTTGLTIQSSDESIATVSGLVVTGVAEGTTTLTITDGTFNADASVFVVPAGTIPSALVVTPTTVSCTPESDDTQLTVFAVQAGGGSVDITDQVAFSSSNVVAALVTTNGAVVCVSEGDATISGSYLGLTVQVPVSVGASPPVSLSVAPSAFTCEVGEMRGVQVLASFADGSTTNVSTTAAYSSSDSAIATAAQGQVSCIAEGSATIVATLSGKSDSVDVTVKQFNGQPGDLVDVRIAPSAIACTVAESVDITVTAVYGDGSTEDVTRSSRTSYQTTDGTIALVSPGQVFCLANGQAMALATFDGVTGQSMVQVQ